MNILDVAARAHPDYPGGGGEEYYSSHTWCIAWIANQNIASLTDG